MNRQTLIEQIISKKSFLCVGLDPDVNKIPAHLKDTSDPVFEFNKIIFLKIFLLLQMQKGETLAIQVKCMPEHFLSILILMP